MAVPKRQIKGKACRNGTKENLQTGVRRGINSRYEDQFWD